PTSADRRIAESRNGAFTGKRPPHVGPVYHAFIRDCAGRSVMKPCASPRLVPVTRPARISCRTRGFPAWPGRSQHHLINLGVAGLVGGEHDPRSVRRESWMWVGVLRGFDRDWPVVVGERPGPVLAFGGRLAGAQRLGAVGRIAI